MAQLDIPQSDASPEDVRKALEVNSKGSQAAFDRLGVNFLESIHSVTAQNVTATAYTKLTDFQTSKKTSGGLVAYIATIGVAITGQTGLVELRIDDKSVLVKAFGNSATGQGQ